MRAAAIAGVLCAAGCQQLLGLGDPSAAPDAAKMLRLSGSAYSASSQAKLAGVSITWMGTNGTTAMTTTDGSGAYALALALDQATIDGYLYAQASGYLDTDLYPGAPFANDTSGFDVPLGTQSELDTAASLVGVTQAVDQGFLGAKVVGSGGAVVGATITTTPSGSLFYVQDGAPSTTATATDASGQAYIFNLPVGAVTVAAKLGAGIQFAPHTVTCRAHRITTTLILEAQ